MTWLLNLNLEKCKVMHIGKTPNVSYSMEISFSPGSFRELSVVNYEKDLGVWKTSTLKPSLHCEKAAANAIKFLAMLKRTFSAFPKDLFIFLYKIYARSHLEYYVQLWCPYLAQDIDTLEKVQKCATKLVCELAKISYESRLKELRIYSLYCRRQRGDLIETYKLLKGYYNLDWTGFFTLSPIQNTRGHHMKLYKKHSRLQLRENFLHRELSTCIVLSIDCHVLKYTLFVYTFDSVFLIHNSVYPHSPVGAPNINSLPSVSTTSYKLVW